MTTGRAGGQQQEFQVITVDAFATRPFTGNPAAICLLPYGSTLSAETMQSIAAELNRTVGYVRALNDKNAFNSDARFGLRWFTPAVEIKQCGHATLGSAAVLFSKFGNPSEAIAFDTQSGDLVVRRESDSLVMNFPVGVSEPKAEADYAELVKALGKIPGVKDVRLCPSLQYLLIRLKDGMTRSEFEQWQVDVGGLQRAESRIKMVMVTTRGTPDQGFVDEQGNALDFVSRVFGPWLGAGEDPVTGSAQTVLAYYWNQELGKTSFRTRQCSKRGGDLQMRLEGDRVNIVGRATLVTEGVIRF